MEKTPHVMLVGSGAQQFAVEEGFLLEEQKLSKEAQKNYDNWLKKSEYKPPAINIENKKNHGPFAPHILDNGEWNHDTIGMVAMDTNGNLSGSCTTSGAGFKMRGRLGDSPIIGAGTYAAVVGLAMLVDGEIWAVADEDVTLDGQTLTTDDRGQVTFPLGSRTKKRLTPQGSSVMG